MTRMIQVFPVWLRVWHWINATLFVILTVTGASLHFAAPDSPFIPFATARLWHNICGLMLTANYLIYLVMNVVSGNVRHYIPRFRGLFRRLWVQGVFYVDGFPKGEHHPFPPTAQAKFNPLQQVTYGAVMYLGMPALVGSGLLYFFPEYMPEQILGWSGLWPVAVFHYVMGLVLATFMLSHIYLGTCGETLTSEFRRMIRGEMLPLPDQRRSPMERRRTDRRASDRRQEAPRSIFADRPRETPAEGDDPPTGTPGGGEAPGAPGAAPPGGTPEPGAGASSPTAGPATGEEGETTEAMRQGTAGEGHGNGNR